MPFELAVTLAIVPEDTAIAGAGLDAWEEAAAKPQVIIMGPIDQRTCPRCMPHVGVTYDADDPRIACWTHGSGMHPRCRHWAEAVSPEGAEARTAPGQGPTGSDFVEGLIADGKLDDLEQVFGPVRARLLAGEQVSLAELYTEKGTAKTLEGMGFSRHGKRIARTRENAINAAESRIRKLPHEECYVFDAAGRELLHKKGVVSEIVFTDAEVDRIIGGYFVHNHPQGTSFSPEDVLFAVRGRFAEMRVVGPTYQYQIMLPKEIRDIPVGARIRYSEMRRTIDEIDQQVRREFIANVNAGIISIEKANALHYHEVWQRYSKKYNFQYSRKLMT